MATAHSAFDTSRLYHCEARPPLASVHGERASDVFTDHSIVLRVPASSRPPLQLNKPGCRMNGNGILLRLCPHHLFVLIVRWYLSNVNPFIQTLAPVL